MGHMRGGLTWNRMVSRPTIRHGDSKLVVQLSNVVNALALSLLLVQAFGGS